MRGRFIIADFSLYGIFVLMMFWDILEEIVPNCQFLIIMFLAVCSIITNNKIIVNYKMLLIMGLITAHGVVSCFLWGASLTLLVKQIVAFIICFISFDTIISKYKVEKIMSVYYESAFIMSILGFIIQAYSLIKGHFYYRMFSLCSEPSFLCYFLAPIVCLILYSAALGNNTKINVKQKKFKSITIIAAYCMTFSSTAFIGLIIMLLMIWKRLGISIRKILMPIVVGILALVVYISVPDIQMRIDDTFNVLKTDNVFTVNLSSYTLYNNAMVTFKTLAETHGSGVGAGSYQVMFDKYSLSNGSEYSDLYIFKFNREDANSLFLRLLAEVGFVGLFLFVFWLVKYHVKGASKYSIYSDSILILFILFLLRQGNYFHCGSVMFLSLYMKIKHEYKMDMMKLLEKGVVERLNNENSLDI